MIFCGAFLPEVRERASVWMVAYDWSCCQVQGFVAYGYKNRLPGARPPSLPGGGRVLEQLADARAKTCKNMLSAPDSDGCFPFCVMLGLDWLMLKGQRAPSAA